MTINNLIEAFIFNFNGKNTVLTTIESLYRSQNVKVDITVIDDHSVDDSVELIRKTYPEVKIHVLPKNTKKLNVLRNMALNLSKGDFVLITDNDINFNSNCLSNLLSLIKSDETIASCTPRLMHWDKPDIVYTAGTKVHFIGAAICDQRDEPFNNNITEPTSNSGGGISLLRRQAALKVGGFDDELLMGWGDDGEFYQRLLRAGYKCLYVPNAFAFHENKIVDSIRKYRVTGQTYNRWVFILSHYSIPLIILLIPVFIMYEILQSGFVLIKGVFPQYLLGNFFVIKNYRKIFRKRKFVQKIRTVPDKEVLFSGQLYVAPALLKKYRWLQIFTNLFSAFLSFYWHLVKKIIR